MSQPLTNTEKSAVREYVHLNFAYGAQIVLGVLAMGAVYWSGKRFCKNEADCFIHAVMFTGATLFAYYGSKDFLENRVQWQQCLREYTSNSSRL